jgi:hypothetical protein
MRRLAFALTAAALLAFAPGSAIAKKPTKVFKGQIILAKWPFPMGFKSDKAFVKHMKRVNTKVFEYDEDGKVEINLMAFFKKARPDRAYSCRVIDTTEGQKALEPRTIDAMPNQKKTQILASGVTLYRDDLPWGDYEQRTFVMVITTPYDNHVLAETKFAIHKTKAEKQAERAAATQRIEAQKKEAERLMNEE